MAAETREVTESGGLKDGWRFRKEDKEGVSNGDDASRRKQRKRERGRKERSAFSFECKIGRATKKKERFEGRRRKKDEMCKRGKEGRTTHLGWIHPFVAQISDSSCKQSALFS